MNYFSALKKSKKFKLFANIIPLVVFIPPLVVISMFLNKTWYMIENITFMLYLQVGILSGGAIALFLFMRLLIIKQVGVEIETDTKGFTHHSPGKVKKILWTEINSIKRIKKGNAPPALQIQVNKSKYTFDPYLIDKDNPNKSLCYGLLRSFWILPDNEVVPMDIENSVGFYLISKFRPDLIEEFVDSI